MAVSKSIFRCSAIAASLALLACILYFLDLFARRAFEALPALIISSDLEIHKVYDWKQFYISAERGVVNVADPDKGNFEMGLDPVSGLYLLRNGITTSSSDPREFSGYAPGVYAFNPREGRFFQLEGELASEVSSRDIQWHNRLRLPLCWNGRRTLSCSTHENKLYHRSLEISFAGEYCRTTNDLGSKRYAIVLSTDGPVKGFGIVGLGGPYYVGQMYQQTYDLEKDAYVGAPVKLPFRSMEGWSGSQSCPTPDEQYVIYYRGRDATEFVFAPTGLPGPAR